MIRLQITKLEKNENYKEEMKEFRNPYSARDRDAPQPKREKESLSVEITEEQFEAIRKAVLEVF